MFVITDKAGVVIHFSNKAVTNGDYVELDTFNCMIKDVNIHEVADITNIKKSESCFDGTNITQNPNYVSPTLSEEKITILEAKNAELESQNAQIILALVQGGLI